MPESTPVDRATAHRLNPLISNLWTEDTLHNAASVVYELGFLLSETELARGHLCLVFDAIAAALLWEGDNIKSCRLERITKETAHV